MPGNELNDDLEQFVAADLVNPDYTDADLRSKLFMETIADVAQATTNVVNSPHGGVTGPNHVTKALNGAGRTLHLLTTGVGGQGKAKVVGLMLFVLTLASTLLIVSVFVSDTPAWVTTVGFAALLGGIGAVALHTRQPLLGALLLTLWLPLVVWSLTPDEAPEVSSDWIGPTLTVVGVAAVLWLVGSVPFAERQRSALSTTERGNPRRPVSRHPRSEAGRESGPTGKGGRIAAVFLWAVLVGLAILLAFTGWSPVEVAGSDPVEYLVPITSWTMPGSTLLIAVTVVAVVLIIVSGALVFLFHGSSGAERAVRIERWTFWFGVGYLTAGVGLLAWLTGLIGDSVDSGRYWPMTVALLLLGVGCLLVTILLWVRSLRGGR